MKILKRLFAPAVALILAVVMLFSVACSSNCASDKDKKPDDNTLTDDEPSGDDGNDDNGGDGGDGDEGSGGESGTPSGGEGSGGSGGESGTPSGGEQSGQGDPTVMYTVTFDYNYSGGDVVTRSVAKGAQVQKISNPERAGHQFVKWTTDSAGNTEYNFNSAVTGDFKLYAQWATLNAKILNVGAFNESLYVVWAEGAPSSASVKYKASNASAWTDVPKELIRANGESTSEARVDIIGLTAGDYNVKITPSAGEDIELPAAVNVSAYDRSGYAHFKYDDGVGAYKDDGTLKDGALVIYVTDANKNDVTESVYKYNASTKTYAKEDIKDYLTTSQTYDSASGVTGGLQTGIGQILNNRRYAGNDRNNVGIAKLCEVYGAVAVRIVGEVKNECAFTSASPKTSIIGLTDYDSTGNGGSVNDNGSMARMVNAHDLTIEGVGEDSQITGWGLHFISSDVLNKAKGPTRAGTSFEVRNITFSKYPEDAIGMEGIQGDKWDNNGSITGGASSATAGLPSAVERCWIHNNTFLPGYCSHPAENDKGEGDGSCDFKRGEYYTLSYNYFTDCHKTNLIGSSDTSLQYNISMHHNWWNNCGSRIPLARRANIHFYNNYVFGDMTADPKPSLSYVLSARADSYIFTENNYFDGTKQVTRKETESGVIKSFGDTLYCNFETNTMVEVSSRDEKVANNCKFAHEKIDYSSFDTNSEQFYYKNGQSDCFLEAAAQARQTVITSAGANGHGAGRETRMFTQEPTASVTPGDNGVSVTFPNAINGVIVNTGKDGKFKGLGVIFKLSGETEITATTSSTEDAAPELVGNDGKVWAHKFKGTLKITLPAGVYAIASGQKDKDCYLTALSFASGETAEERIQAAKDAINAIPDINSLTVADREKVTAARNAYNALNSSEKGEIEANLVTKLTSAENKINQLLADGVIALINAIGNVTQDSYNKINAARSAYNDLPSAARSLVTNYGTLTAAEEAFAQFAVKHVIDWIDEFKTKATNLDGKTKAELEELLTEANAIEAEYDGLSSDEDNDQQSLVTNYGDLTDTTAKINQALKWFDFTEALAEFDDPNAVTAADGAKVAALQKAYNALSSEQKSKAETENLKTKYDAIVAKYDEVKPKTVSVYLDGGKGSDEGKVIQAIGDNKSTTVTLADGNKHTGMKFQSGSGAILITINSNEKVKVTVYVDVSTSLKSEAYALSGAFTGFPSGYSGGTASAVGTTANDYGLYEWTAEFDGADGTTFLITKGDKQINAYYVEVEYLN